MELQERINKIINARDKVANIYEIEATDELPDNGNLSVLSAAILSLNNAIENLNKRK